MRIESVWGINASDGRLRRDDAETPAVKDPQFERWKQPICDAIMRRIKCRQA
jgi:hypothetical protein